MIGAPRNPYFIRAMNETRELLYAAYSALQKSCHSEVARHLAPAADGRGRAPRSLLRRDDISCENRFRAAGIHYDIRLAAEYMLEDTSGATSETFLANRLLRQAVERNLLNIGEAVNRLRRYDPAIAERLTAVPQIVGM